MAEASRFKSTIYLYPGPSAARITWYVLGSVMMFGDVLGGASYFSARSPQSSSTKLPSSQSPSELWTSRLTAGNLKAIGTLVRTALSNGDTLKC